MARLAGLLVVVLAVAGAASALLLGGGEAPPDGAATLVPADALAYVHLSTDPHRPATQQALDRARRLPDYPLISTYVLQRLDAIIGGGQVVDFASRIRPWLGREAALALLNTATSTADSLIVLDVADVARARRFLAAQHAVAAGRYRGVPLLRYPATGTSLAFLSHYLVLGQAASVQRAVDVAGGAAPLAQDPSYRAAAQGEPDDRVLDLYASAPGERRLLVAANGLTGLLGTLLDDPALSGVRLGVSPAPSGARIWIHRALDPTLLKLGSSHPRPFTPTLQNALPDTALAAVQVRGLGGFVPKLLGTAGGSGLGGPLGSLLRRLTGTLSAEGIDLHQIGALFAGESAFALLDHAGRTSLLLVTRTARPAQAGQELAGLEAPLAQLFPPPGSGPGRAAVFSNVTIDGVAAHQLQLNPGLEFDYAIWNGMVIVSTSLDGIAQVARHARPLSDTAAFTRALGNRPSQVTSLLFLDFSQLLGIGEQTGLLRGKLLSTLRPDLQRIRTVGLSSTGGEADTTAELLLQIP